MAKFGPITKLTVNIGKGETRISYGNASTRVIYANPSGLAFPGGMMDPSLISDPYMEDNRYRPESFLQRHFSLLAKRLPNLMGITAPDSSEVEDPVNKDVVWYTWHSEEVEKLEPQRVEFIEWKAPETGTVKIFNRFWHLQNCFAKKRLSHKSESPKCYCLKIKQITDHIKDLIASELPEHQSVDDDASKPHVFDTKIKEVNDSLKQLHDLLELQEQCNRNQLLRTRGDTDTQ
ncbi:uncharacterized protein LOC117187697 [Drosophila miranda]|uniref:uncharacterized protein LOC117187697 n=1 Tax=Drosophila miranda TaxID=7229 RepID=UPI0007E76F4A|nr:uncharacterized protein LOC117187697 [Drosophila miranda]